MACAIDQSVWCLLNMPSTAHSSKTRERMEGGNFRRAQGEMQELESASHGGKKQWPSMTPEEEDLISRLYHLLGDRWELIAQRLPDRTADEVESYWKMKENKIYKPVCTRLSPSFKFTMDEALEDTKPSQTGS